MTKRFLLQQCVLISILLCLPSLISAQEVPAAEEANISLPPPAEGSKIVKSIEVEGNKTISIATILSKVKTRVGQEYMQSVISDDLKRLYNTGYFSDVRVDRQEQDEGFKVIFYLEEKPIIDEITFSRTRYFNAKSLKKKITTKAGTFLDNKSLKDDIATIKELYNKKGLTMADVDVETFVDDTTNKASLHFIIKEGYKVKIRRINVFGNDTFPDKKILGIIKTRRSGIFTSGYLKEDQLEEDMGRITSYYEKQGFIDAKVSHAIEYLYQGRIDVNVTIEEGKRYYVGDLVLTGNDIVSEKEILKVMKEVKVADVFSRERLSVDIANIRTLYFDQGYIFADVSEATSLDSETGEVAVRINIKEGDPAYIEKVKIQGNTRTRDIVIRRELKLYPGDRFDGVKLRRSKERLTNLGYFEDINFDIEDTDSADRKNLVVQVKEAKTGTFSFGGGFSTVDQLIGFVEVEQRNFDFTNWPTFTGGGQNLVLRAETGSTRNNLRLSFTEPWIFDHPVSGGFDAYLSERERDEDTGYAYDEKRIGGDIRFGKQFSDIVSGTVTYTNETVTIDNFVPNVSADLLAEQGETNISQIGVTATRDTTNSSFNPTEGLVLWGGVDLAGTALGGDKDFFRTQFRTNYYLPLKFNSVLELRFRAGIVDAIDDTQKVPIFERFFAGGARSIRGYDERSVGPIDSVTGDPIGGESLLVANIEYVIPVVEFIKLATFFDTGNVWADTNDFASGSLKSGAGLGLRIKTPIGPVNLDYGYPLNDQEGQDKEGKFYFSVSRGF